MNFNEQELNFITQEFQKDNIENNLSKSHKRQIIDNIYKYKSNLNIDILPILKDMKNDKKSVLLAIIFLGDLKTEFKYNPKQFWYFILKLKEFYVLFKKISPFKIRNIWEKLKQGKKNFPLIVDIIQKDNNIINESYGIQLIDICNILVKISKGNETNINTLCEKLKQEIKKIPEIQNKLVKKKEKKEQLKTNSLEKEFKINNKINLDINIKKVNTKTTDKNSGLKILNYSLFTKDTNKEEFDLITSAIQDVGKYFNNVTKEQILNILNSTSLNPGHAYLQLKYPEKANFDFLESEDYIIKYMKNTSLYEELIYQKGEILKKEKERYLNINN